MAIGQGMVVKSTGSVITIVQENGIRTECILKGQFRIQGLRSTNPVAIGDKVDFELTGNEKTGVITKIHERTNYIVRKATKLSKVTHILAANIDQAFLVATLAFPKTSTGFIDRFLVTATAYYIPGKIIFNKIDLYNTSLQSREDELRRIYEKAGYPCFSVSALRGDNMNAFCELLAGKVTLFSGHSGAGKTALINAINPILNLKTGVISKIHKKGMHTTTFPEMFETEGKGFIIDTPGIKEFGLIDFDRTEIPRCFPEMDRLLSKCQFRNCTHVNEPNCAVKHGIITGEVSELRYNSYLSILND